MNKKILAVIVAAAILFGAFGTAKGLNLGKSNGSDAVASSNSSTSSNSVADTISDDDPLKDIKLSLIVDLDQATLAKMYTEFSKEFLDSSMPNRNAARTIAASKVGWGRKGQHMYDAVSFPFSEVKKGKTSYSEEDINRMYEELQEEIMRNPVVGDMVIQGMQYLALTDETTLAELNESWVQDFENMYDDYGPGAFVTYHTAFWQKYGYELPHDNMDVETWKSKHPQFYETTADGTTPEEDLEAHPELKALLRENDSDELEPTAVDSTGDGRIGKVASSETRYTLYVSDYYIRSAKRILSWLDRCTQVGVKTYKTTTHWYLNSATNANNVRTVRNEDASYVDQQPALVLSIDTKDGKRQVLFGFNIYDMRLEIFNRTAKPVKPNSPKPTPKAPSNPTPGKKTPSTPKKTTPGKNTPKPGKTTPNKPEKGKTTPNTPSSTPVNPSKPEPTPVTPNDPEPDLPRKDPTQDPVNQGNAQKGGGDNDPSQSDPGPATSDPSKNDMKDEHGGESTNQGHSDPSTVQPATPQPSGSHTNREGKKDDHNSSTIEHTDENKMNYGEENHNQKTTVTDNNGSNSGSGSSSGSGKTTTTTSDEARGNEFSEPDID